MAYFLSPALVRLRAEVNALWPGRSKASDGWIGDTSHAARKSDHNPDYSAAGIVRAIDVTNDGINVDAFISSVIRDARCRYVISRGRIWTRESGWQRYTGANAHNHHVHVSVRTGGGYDMQVHSWGLSTTVGNNLGGGGSVTVPNIPGAPAPISPEDDLSAQAEANIARALQILEAFDPERQKLQTAADRIMGVLPETTDLLAAKVATGVWSAGVGRGENRRTMSEVLASLPADVWRVKVQRAGQSIAAIQELADAKTNTAKILGENAALKAALESVQGGAGLTADQITEAARVGAEAALKDGVKVTIEIPQEN